MKIKSLGGVLTPNQGFECLRCRLGNVTVNLGRTRRYQQTSAPYGIRDVINLPPLDQSKDSQTPLKSISEIYSEERQPSSILRSTDAATKPLHTAGQGPITDTSISKPVQAERESQARLQQKYNELQGRRKGSRHLQADDEQLSQTEQRHNRKAVCLIQSKADDAQSSQTEQRQNGIFVRFYQFKAHDPQSSQTEQRQNGNFVRSYPSKAHDAQLLQTEQHQNGILVRSVQSKADDAQSSQTEQRQNGNLVRSFPSKAHDAQLSQTEQRQNGNVVRSCQSKTKAPGRKQGAQAEQKTSNEALKAGGKRGSVKDSTKSRRAANSGSKEAGKANKKSVSVEDATPKKRAGQRGRIKAAGVGKKSGNVKDTPKRVKKLKMGPFHHHVEAKELKISAIETIGLSVPGLSHGLERVLFNPGVYHLQDQRSRVFNFDPYLQTILPVEKFNFNTLNKFNSPSEDDNLKNLAKAYGKRYVGSSSSMTGVLSHFHYLLSQWRKISTSKLSSAFCTTNESREFTERTKCPISVFLRWKGGSYAIDADKEFDNANILSFLGQSMEKLLTSDKKSFERYRKSNPDQVSSEEIKSCSDYHYSTLGDLLMRSQLDAYDARLPGTGMFDLKTRSVVSIRMDLTNYELGMGYQIKMNQGSYQSFEREYYDMIRAAFLKYSLQVRMGRMDGVFVAYHNIDTIFGFQYVSLPEMDQALHGTSDTTLGDQEFKLSLDLFNKILDKATKKYPETSLRIFFETRETKTPSMYIFAEPMTEVQIQNIQSTNVIKTEEFERSIGLTDGAPSTAHEQDEEITCADIETSVEEAVTEDELSIVDANTDQEDEESQQALTDDDTSSPSTKVSSLDGGEVSEQPHMIGAEATGIRDEHLDGDGEVLAMTLTVRNKVNGKNVQRPFELSSTDDWSVEYVLLEVPDVERAQSLYQACKRRRPGDKETRRPAEDRKYIQSLRKLSRQGAAWRKEMDEKDKASPRVVLEQSLLQQQGKAEEWGKGQGPKS